MPVHIADEVEALAREHKRIQRLHRHARPQIGAADADIHHIGDGGIGTHGLRKRQKGRAHGIHLAPHILQGGRQAVLRRRTQQPVHDLALLGGVDRPALEHRIAQRQHALLFGQLQQGLHHALVQVRLGKIRVQQRTLAGVGQGLAEALDALRVFLEGTTQVKRGGIEQAIPPRLMVIDWEAARQLA